jgi:hypothetical protein
MQKSQLIKATFNNEGISNTSILYYKTDGKLINLISEDRTAVSDIKTYPFSTPVSKEGL